MSQTVNQKPIKKETRESMNKNAQTKARQQNLIYAEEISRLGLMRELMAPSFRKIHTDLKLLLDTEIKLSYFNSPFYQALNMDLTSYQTLKQLIIENKSLVKESESAYFLSKQSQKLINFIDGWNNLQKNQYFEENYQIEESIVEKRTSKQRKTRATQKQAQNHQILYDEETEPEPLNQPIQNNKLMKKLSSKPALIIQEEQQKDGYLIQKEDSEGSDAEIEIQIETENEPMNNENNINSSNINVVENEKEIENEKAEKKKDKKPKTQADREQKNFAKSNKAIKLYSNVSATNIEPSPPELQKDQSKDMNNEIEDLSEIIRPEYQKTEISFSSSSDLTNSRQTQNINVEVTPYQLNPPLAKKKTIPLLKKGKSSLGYNELVQANKLASKSRVEGKNEQIAQVSKANQQLREKGFISEDTDANSRLSMLTNKPTIKTSTESKEPQGRRSLSPKVENNKKKVLIKRGSTNSGKDKQQSTFNAKDEVQVMKQREDVPTYKQASKGNEKNMEMELKQLEEELMNRKSNQQLQSLTQKQESPKSFVVNSIQQDNVQQYQSQLFTKPAPRQNKTLKLIKKSSSSNSLTSEEQREQKIQPSVISHYPLTNANNSRRTQLNMQKHSVVLEEEPWECDELELEEELKALDEKIMGRKSMLTAKKNSLGGDHEQSSKSNPYTHQRFNSTQQFTTSPLNTIQPISKHHKRSNTSSNLPLEKKNFYEDQIYHQHLFEENQELFGNEIEQKEQHSNNSQPKVVRLSLTALANNMNKKSRDSMKNERKSHEKKSLKKDLSSNNLKKEPSCKSILLYEQAQKRGISPSKSAKSLKSNNNNNNNRHISPIKQYTLPNNQQKTPRNIQKPQILPHHPTLNTYEPYEQELTPTSKQQDSRTLSEMVDSEYSRAQKYLNGKEFLMMANHQREDCRNNAQMRRGFDERAILNQTDYLRNDTSTFSNCERYFDHYQGHVMEQPPSQQHHLNREEIPPAKKWNVPQSRLTQQTQKNKFVLLSDQLGDC